MAERDLRRVAPDPRNRVDAHFLNSIAALGAPNILRLELDVGYAPIGAHGQQPLARAGLLVVNPPHTLIEEARTLLPWLAQTLARGGVGQHVCAWLTEPSLSAPRMRLPALSALVYV